MASLTNIEVTVSPVESGAPTCTSKCKQWHKVMAFVTVCVLAATLSGGLILGVGPFESKLVQEGYFASRCKDGVVGCTAQYDAIAPIFDGGFQMMTWCTCIFGILLERIGPRFVACAGLLLAMVGFSILAFATDEVGVTCLMVAYGLVGGGCNGLYISSFHFAFLFQNIGLACAILAGLFNLAGLMFMVLDIPAITLNTFFFGYLVYTGCCMLVVMLLYPDKKYRVGDDLTFQFPTCAHVELTVTYTCETKSEGRCTMFRGLGRRYWWFVAAFSWSALTNQVMGGFMDDLAVSRGHSSGRSPGALNAFENYSFPIIGNCTFIFTSFVGMIVDRYGFMPVFILQAAVTQGAILCCFLPSFGDQYLTLVLYNLTQAVIYSIEFSYLMITYPMEIYGQLVALTIALQGIVGFIAWPILSPNPFGSDAFSPVLWILFVPATLILYSNAYIQWQDRGAWAIPEPPAEDAEPEEARSRRGSFSASFTGSFTGSITGKVGMDYGAMGDSRRGSVSSDLGVTGAYALLPRSSSRESLGGPDELQTQFPSKEERAESATSGA